MPACVPNASRTAHDARADVRSVSPHRNVTSDPTKHPTRSVGAPTHDQEADDEHHDAGAHRTDGARRVATRLRHRRPRALLGRGGVAPRPADRGVPYRGR
ncbi:hypothetical protein PLANTIT3_60883 [Plantibacter sp. T3]|nr:hypothetical protein PLANTIT3_60883 [Plantibacter sp. T3]